MQLRFAQTVIENRILANPALNQRRNSSLLFLECCTPLVNFTSFKIKAKEDREFAQIKDVSTAGVIYKDTFFVNNLHQTESIYFHELVHVVQWERLGVDNFLLAYIAGLMQFGYQDSPLEQMAYSMQEDFGRESLPNGIIELIRQRTDAIWTDVASLIANVRELQFRY